MKRAVPGRPRLSVRLARTLALDTNPLRRASDRAEAWIRVVLIAVFLVVGPMAALTAASWGHHPGTAASARTAQAHLVGAVLLEPTPAAFAPTALRPDGPVWVPARWQSPGAPARTGEVLAPSGLPAGSVVKVWVTASGRFTSPPPEPGQLGGKNVLAEVIITLVVVALTSLAVQRLVRLFLNRRRLAAWEAAWSAVAPRWTGHRP